MKTSKKVAKKVTKTNKKVAKKATKIAPARNSNLVTMTPGQAKQLQAFALKNKKSFKFLDTKISAL